MSSTVDTNYDEPSLSLLLSNAIDRECGLGGENDLGGKCYLPGCTSLQHDPPP